MIVWLMHLQIPQLVDFYSVELIVLNEVAKLLIKEFSCNAKNDNN